MLLPTQPPLFYVLLCLTRLKRNPPQTLEAREVFLEGYRQSKERNHFARRPTSKPRLELAKKRP
jgi:hypothetical protein